MRCRDGVNVYFPPIVDDKIKAIVAARTTKLSQLSPRDVWANNILGYVPGKDLCDMMRVCKFMLLVVLYHMRKVRENDLTALYLDFNSDFDCRLRLEELMERMGYEVSPDLIIHFLPRIAIYNRESSVMPKTVDCEQFNAIKKKVFVLSLEARGVGSSINKLLSLENFPNVKQLTLGGLIAIEKTGIRLNNNFFCNITVFDVSCINLSEADFSCMQKLKRLEIACCLRLKIKKDMSLSLKYVRLFCTDLTDVDFSCLASVEELSISGVYLQVSLNINKDMPNLKKLSICDCVISGVNFYCLRGLKKLMLFGATGINKSYKKLGDLKGLRVLHIKDVNDFTKKDAESIRDILPNLKEFKYKIKES